MAKKKKLLETFTMTTARNTAEALCVAGASRLATAKLAMIQTQWKNIKCTTRRRGLIRQIMH